MEKMCKAAKGGWLMGTKDITMLDIWCGAWWEFMYMADCSTQAEDYVMFPHRLKYFKAKVQISKNAPSWRKYVERFRAHPAIKPYAMKQEVFDSQSKLSRACEDADQYSRLMLASMKGHYPEF